MDTGLTILAIVLVAVLAGLYLLIWRNKSKTKLEDTQGMLNVVYDGSGNNPQLVLALYDPVETIINQKQVLFDVNIIHQDSRK